MNILKCFLIGTVLLSNAWLLLSMEQPQKKTRFSIKTPKIYQPLTLAEQSADAVIASFATHQPRLNKIPLDLVENHIYIRLMSLLKSKYNSPYMSRYKITTQAFDSNCAFSNNGQNIISTHCSINTVEVFKVLDFLKENLNTVCKLECAESEVICVNPQFSKVFFIDNDNCLQEFELQNCATSFEDIEYDYLDELTEISHDEDLQFVNIKKVSLTPGKHEKFKKIIAPSRDALFVLSQVVDSHGNYKKQNIAMLDAQKEKNTRLLFSTYDEAKKVSDIFITNANTTLYVHEDGDFQVRDCNNKIIIPLQNRTVPCALSACAVNKHKNIIAIADDLKNITVYNLDTKKITHIKQPHISNAITFFDDNYLIAAHNEETVMTEKVSLSLWNISDGACIATSQQKEGNYCNSLDICPNGSHLLLGMGRYDVAVQTLNSFKFVDGVVPKDMKLLCESKNAHLLEMLARKDATFLDKLLFLENISK